MGPGDAPDSAAANCVWLLGRKPVLRESDSLTALHTEPRGPAAHGPGSLGPLQSPAHAQGVLRAPSFTQEAAVTNLRQRLRGRGSDTHGRCRSLDQLRSGRGGQVTASVWHARPVTHLTGGHLCLMFWWFLT